MFNFITNLLKKRNRDDLEYFDEEWKNRIKVMCLHIPSDVTVIDLGCGKMWLKDYLLPSQKYIGVDYKKRGENLVCNFNQKEFPSVEGDVYFLSGILEYITDIEWFFDSIAKTKAKHIILSYCSTDVSTQVNVAGREHNGRVNHFSLQELREKLATRGFSQERFEICYNGNFILKFSRA